MTGNTIYNHSKQMSILATEARKMPIFDHHLKWALPNQFAKIDFTYYCFNIQANISGATIVASLSTMNFGVWISNLPQVIFSFGTAPE